MCRGIQKCVCVCVHVYASVCVLRCVWRRGLGRVFTTCKMNVTRASRLPCSADIKRRTSQRRAHTTTHAFQMMKQDTIDRRTLKHVKFFHKTSQSSNDAIAVWACAIGYGDGWPKHGLVTRAVNLLEGVVGSTVGPFQGVTKYDFEIGLFKDSLSSRSVVDQHTRPQVDASLLGFATIR